MRIDALKIKQIRTQKNWSQEQLSERSGLSLRTIQRIETTQIASKESINRIAQAFGLEPDSLMSNIQQSYTKPLQSIQNSFLEFSNFSGKTSRYDYWCFLIFVILCLAIATIIHEKLYQIVGGIRRIIACDWKSKTPRYWTKCLVANLFIRSFWSDHCFLYDVITECR